MAEKEIVVLARLKARGGMEEQVKEELLRLVAPTRREEGCVRYDLHRHLENPGEFLFYEIWRSRKDLDEHMGTPHFKGFLEKAKGLLSEPGEVTLWERIA